MGLFAGIKDAKVSQGGVYLKPGVFTTRIEACKSGKTRANVVFFVVELDILESNNSELPPGTRCSWMVTLDKEPALGNIKAFLAVATDSKEEEIDEAGVELVVSADNPLKDTIVRVSAVNIKTKAGTDFTKCTFLPADARESASA
jgi:hypothetical protein